MKFPLLKTINPFWLPSPVDLGKSKYDALPLRKLSNNPLDEYTWEDYDAQIQKEFPVRRLFGKVIPRLFNYYISMPIEKVWYWIKSHTYRRHHIIDLRQPKREYYFDNYRYGWIDSDQKILFACFKVLTDFIEKEHPEEIVDVEHESYVEHWKEIQTIYKYWKEDRGVIQSQLSDFLHKAFPTGQPTNKEYVTKLNDLEKHHQELETEMLVRLIKVRGHMWS